MLVLAPWYSKISTPPSVSPTGSKITSKGGTHFANRNFRFKQTLDLTALQGRYFSSSYAPKVGSPDRKTAEAALANIFDKHAFKNCVDLEYTTELFLGLLL
jgi:hypothetical protein